MMITVYSHRKKKKKDAICFTVRKFTRYIQQDLQCNSPCLACSFTLCSCIRSLICITSNSIILVSLKALLVLSNTSQETSEAFHKLRA